VNPSIAVIISARNAASTIGATLDSLSRQSRREFQVVVYDDASEDQTFDIASSWSSKLSLSVIRGSERVGPGLGRNLAVAQTDCDLICIVDSDDLLLQGHIAEHELRFRNGAVITATRFAKWTPGSKMPMLPSSRIPKASKQWPKILLGNFMPGCSSVARTAFEHVGGYRGGDIHEDWDLWIRLFRAGYRAVDGGDVTYLYRQSADSRSSSPFRAEMTRAVLEMARTESCGRQDCRYAVAALRANDIEQLSLLGSSGSRRESFRLMPAAAVASLTNGDWNWFRSACRQIVSGGRVPE